jgi:hypothetical protein
LTILGLNGCAPVEGSPAFAIWSLIFWQIWTHWLPPIRSVLPGSSLPFPSFPARGDNQSRIHPPPCSSRSGEETKALASTAFMELVPTQRSPCESRTD